MIGREAEMKGSVVKCEKRQLAGGGGVCEISGLTINNGAMEAVEYMCVDMWCLLD